MKEKDLQKQIIDWLRYHHIFCFKVNNVGIKKPNGKYIPVGLRGIADIIGLLPPDGKFLAIEVKLGSKPSEYQIEFLDNISRSGGIGFFAYSLEDVIKVLG